MEAEGTPIEEARSKIWMVDSKGLIVNNRPKGGVSGHKKDFAKDFKPIDKLEDVVKEIKPTALIGIQPFTCWICGMVCPSLN
jgi:malate dehydrogenase (oxaloacetate-decarboxylating)(NADP+)